MKKIAVVLSLGALVFALASCGGPEADAKLIIKKQEAIVKLQKKAAADSLYDDQEIEAIVNEFINNHNDAEKIRTKYEDNQEQKEVFEKELERLTIEFDSVYTDELKSLNEIEGAKLLSVKIDANFVASIYEENMKVQQDAVQDGSFSDEEIEAIVKSYIEPYQSIEMVFYKYQFNQEDQKLFITEMENLTKAIEEKYDGLIDTVKACENFESLEEAMYIGMTTGKLPSEQMEEEMPPMMTEEEMIEDAVEDIIKNSEENTEETKE